MPRLFYTPAFERKYKKLLKAHPGLKKRISERLNLLEKDPYASALRFHSLEGPLNDLYAVTIDYDLRVIIDAHFDADAFYLVDIGSHDDVY
jgi:mRNA-degrading endonuclease YafQ of YafQ-DinJ toxin-antitoxin module